MCPTLPSHHLAIHVPSGAALPPWLASAKKQQHKNSSVSVRSQEDSDLCMCERVREKQMGR